MDKAKAQQLLDDVRRAIQEVEKKHDLLRSNITLRFTDSGGTFKIVVAEKSTADSAESESSLYKNPKYIQHLEKHGYRAGLNMSMLGQKFDIRGKSYLLVGMSSAQFVVLQNVNDGKLYRFSSFEIHKILSR